MPLTLRYTRSGWRHLSGTNPSWLALLAVSALPLTTSTAEAAMFQGEALDRVADLLAWAVLVIVPIVGIAVFWIVHILPEKIAERRQHPQAKAIQTLCLLSLFFGGLLWPLAWLWAYSKPVLYKLAYGTDQVPHDHGDAATPTAEKDDAQEIKHLRKRLAELESKQSGKVVPEGGKT